MNTALIEVLVLGTIFFLVLAFVFKPRAISLRILRLLQQGPKTENEIATALELPAEKVLTVLHLMETWNHTIEREFQSPWDDQGNKRPTEIYRITSIGTQMLMTESEHETPSKGP